MLSLQALVTTLVACLFLLDTVIAEPLHIVVTPETPDERREGEAGVVLRRRVFLSDGVKLLNFTNDDDNVMIDCQQSDSPSEIRRVIVLRRRPHSEDDVIGTKRTYEDRDGSTFAKWEKACSQINKRRHTVVTKRKVFPEIVYPGTKWCGPGDDSEDYGDLGPLENTDKCCRAHDNCPVHILPFTTKYHYFNYRPWTITHCTCDEHLFDCLKDVGREVPAEKKDSNIVGDAFFREVNPPCFRIERNKYCAKRHWSQLWCEKWAWADKVATIRSFLENQWPKVNHTDEIPNKPPTQEIF